MTQNILEEIAGICKGIQGRDGEQEALLKIKDLTSRNASILTQILDDYIRQNEEDQTYRKHRLKGAKRMLGIT